MMNPQLRETFLYHAIKPAILSVGFACTIAWVVLAALQMQWVSLIVGAAFCLLMFVLFLIATIHILYAIYCRNSYDAYVRDVVNDPDNIVLFEGLQRTGKSDTAKRAAIIRAEANWASIVSEYTLLSHLVTEHMDDPEWIEHYREIRDTYLFYRARPWLFPCLISNVCMRVDGMETLQFNFGMILQQIRIPYKSVIVLDEMKNSGLSNRDSGKIPREFDEMLRFVAQFYEATIYATEQNKVMAILEYRNMAVNYTMQSMDKDVLKPHFLQWIYAHRFRRFWKKYGIARFRFRHLGGDPFHALPQPFRYVRRSAELYRIAQYKIRTLLAAYVAEARKLDRLRSLIERIGFIKYVRVFRGSTQGNTVNDANQSAATSDIIGRRKIWSYYMPAIRRYRSNTRLFRGINRAKDLPWHLTSWGDQSTISRAYWDALNADRLRCIRAAKERSTPDDPSAFL